MFNKIIMENDLCDIYEQLKATKIPLNAKRPNISGLVKRDKVRNIGQPVETCTFGLVYDLNRKEYVISNISKKFPVLFSKIIDFGKKYVNHDFSSIQVNHNIQCLKHKDRNNKGVSSIIGIGNYIGGELVVIKDGIEKIKNIRHKFHTFDGHLYEHYTKEFEGDRYSLVFFK